MITREIWKHSTTSETFEIELNLEKPRQFFFRQVDGLEGWYAMVLCVSAESIADAIEVATMEDPDENGWMQHLYPTE